MRQKLKFRRITQYINRDIDEYFQFSHSILMEIWKLIKSIKPLKETWSIKIMNQFFKILKSLFRYILVSPYRTEILVINKEIYFFKFVVELLKDFDPFDKILDVLQIKIQYPQDANSTSFLK